MCLVCDRIKMIQEGATPILSRNRTRCLPADGGKIIYKNGVNYV